MSNWACDAPWDVGAKFNSRMVFTEEEILRFYGDGNRSRQEIIDEWVVVNWAFRTDMPRGEYVTSNRVGRVNRDTWNLPSDVTP